MAGRIVSQPSTAVQWFVQRTRSTAIQCLTRLKDDRFLCFDVTAGCDRGIWLSSRLQESVLVIQWYPKRQNRRQTLRPAQKTMLSSFLLHLRA